LPLAELLGQVAQPECWRHAVGERKQPSDEALVGKMDAAGLSAKTIINYTGLVKLVVASAKSEEGEPLFPRKWDSEFIDLPIVRNQRQPMFAAETMSAIVQNTTGQYRVLYAFSQAQGFASVRL
jgi:hypothetical protein